MPEAPRISYHAKRLLARLKCGQTLHAQVDKTEEGIAKGGLRYWLEPSGKNCGPSGAKELIQKGILKQLSDGLFVDTPQSWRLP